MKNQFGLILDVGWFESWYIPQPLEIPIFHFKKYIYKENKHNTMLIVILTYIWMILKYVEKTSAMEVV